MFNFLRKTHALPEPATLPREAVDVLFLDFDGVLHPLGSSSRFFCHVPKLLPLFREAANLRVVVTSDWRFSHEDEELREELGDLGAFFWASTPKIENLHQTHFPGDPEIRQTRQREILWFLHKHPEIRKWLAVDDIPDLYEESFLHQHVVHTNPHTGLEDCHIELIRQYFQES